MSATEQLLEQVKTMTPAEAESVLEWLGKRPVAEKTAETPAAIAAARGWCKKYNLPYKTTDEYMKAMREGEEYP